MESCFEKFEVGDASCIIDFCLDTAGVPEYKLCSIVHDGTAYNSIRFDLDVPNKEIIERVKEPIRIAIRRYRNKCLT